MPGSTSTFQQSARYPKPIDNTSFSVSDNVDDIIYVGTYNPAEERRKIIEVMKKQIEMLISWNSKEEKFIRLAFSDITKKLGVSFEEYSGTSQFYAALARKVKENPIVPQFPAFVDETVQELSKILQEYPEKSIQAECAFFKLALQFDANKNYKTLVELYNHMSL